MPDFGGDPVGGVAPPVDGTPRADFLDELDRFAREHPSLSVPELARAFGQTLPERNLRLVQRLLAADAYALLAARFRSRFSRTRHEMFASLDIPNLNPAEATPKRVVTAYEKIQQWREWVPEHGHKLLMEMSKREIHLAWLSRTERMMAEAWRAEVLHRIDDKLEQEEQLVSTKFTVEQVASLIQATRSDMYRGRVKLAIKAVPPEERIIPKRKVAT